MSNQSASLAKVLALITMLAGAECLRAADVSQFLTVEFGTNLSPGIPGAIAYDGTNFLLAARSSNREIMTLLLATNGLIGGLPRELGRTGGDPRAAFDGANYLVAWPDFGGSLSDIYGQFIRPDGSGNGSPFLIEAEADANEMGGLAFDGTNYLAVWEANAGSSNTVSTVQGRLISRAGELVGPLLQISSSATGQKSPSAVWNGKNYLVVWTGQTEGINEWNIQGCRLNRDGGIMDRVVISDNPAQQPWPPALASDGTNWLVAWSRESGPYTVRSSSLWLPMLYGRLVAANGTVSGPEVQIRSGGLGQFRPKAAFNGDNYLVGWMERSRSDQSGPPPYADWYWQAAVREVNSSGQPVTSEFPIFSNYNIYSVVNPPGLAMGAGSGRFLMAVEEIYHHSIWEHVLVRLSRAFTLGHTIRLLNGDMQFDLVAPNNRSYGLELSTNLANWTTIGGDLRYFPAGQRTVSASALGTSDRTFLRVFDGQTACRENQRLIQQAKAHWALEHDKTQFDQPTDSDLFGTGGYLPNKPVCPNGGSYYLYQGVSEPSCSFGAVAGHTY